jgi:2-dehydro-3-deoxyphosphogalactonate aldolase
MNEAKMTIDETMAEMPIVAIIRGVTPDEVGPIAEALYNSGVRIVEIPLNSPDPLESLSRMARDWKGRLWCGSGTVLGVGQVEQVKAAGGQFVVSPDTKPVVIRRCVELGLEPMPGFASSTEMFQAVDAGARYLKLFPAVTYGPAHVSSLSPVVPKGVRIMAVGGVGAKDMAAWWAAGTRGFGMGGELYKPGWNAEQVFDKARAVVTAMRALVPGELVA